MTYGFAQRRAEMARQFGVTSAWAEKEWPDEWFHQNRREGETRGEDITGDFLVSRGLSCATCGGPSHMTPAEWEDQAAVLNTVYYRIKGHPSGDFGIRFGATSELVDEALTLATKFGRTNRDRCVAARVRQAATAGARP